ncbi:MAG: 50S ribosomal protein L24 [Candidatus Bilamarchaeum sp.]|jgi:large subunit ribosomal protein L24
MKSDTERKKFYTEPLHLRRNRLHVHLSKDLRGKLKTKKRAVLLRKGDTVKILRGPKAGTSGKVSKVSVLRRKVFVEGAVSKTAKGREVALALEASNLLLIGLESTPERKEIFKDDAFVVAKKETKKEEKASEKAPKSENKTHDHSTHQHGEGHKKQ